VGLGLDKDNFAGRCAAECIPLWSSGGPEVLQPPLRKPDPKPIKECMVAVFGELIVCARRTPLYRTDTDGLIQHIWMLIYEVLDPAKAALRTLRLRESTHQHLPRSSAEPPGSEQQ
jgi:hypothetical protein